MKNSAFIAIFGNDVSQNICFQWYHIYTKYTQTTQKLNTRSKLLPSRYFETVTVSNSDGEPYDLNANELCPAVGHY